MRLERRNQPDLTPEVTGGNVTVLMTPPVSEAYWLYRVGVTEAQAVIGFPKFGTIGIGFAVEEDWNTNLPASCDSQAILDHIWHNAGPSFDEMHGPRAKALVKRAIEMIQEAVREDRLANHREKDADE